MSRFGIPWLDAVDLSTKYFDKDHHALLKKFSSLINAISCQDRVLVLDATSALVDVAKEHFAHEERHMHESSYHSRNKHRASHRQLLQSLAEFHQKVIQMEDLSALPGASAFLEHWLVPHLSNDDKRFSEYLSAQEYLKNVSPP